MTRFEIQPDPTNHNRRNVPFWIWPLIALILAGAVWLVTK